VQQLPMNPGRALASGSRSPSRCYTAAPRSTCPTWPSSSSLETVWPNCGRAR
jgi:hypothetical protein